MDPQEGGEDVLDREWEHEQRRDTEDLGKPFSKASPGCLPFCLHSRTHDDAPPKVVSSLAANSQPFCAVDFVYPGE